MIFSRSVMNIIRNLSIYRDTYIAVTYVPVISFDDPCMFTNLPLQYFITFVRKGLLIDETSIYHCLKLELYVMF